MYRPGKLGGNRKTFAKYSAAAAACVLCMGLAGMPAEASSAQHTIHDAVSSVGVGSILDDSVDTEQYLAAAENAKQERKKIYGYENLGIANVNDYLNVREAPGEDQELVGKMPRHAGADVLGEEDG